MRQAPRTKNDFIQMEDHIGDASWEATLRRILEEYQIPNPAPVSIDLIGQAETRCGVSIPEPLVLLLTRVGPIDFDGIAFLQPEDIDIAKSLWFADRLSSDEQLMLPRLLKIADYCSSGDFVLMNVLSTQCYLATHDPPELGKSLQNLDDLIKVCVIDLACSRYGWDDDNVFELAQQMKMQMFGCTF